MKQGGEEEEGEEEEVEANEEEGREGKQDKDKKVVEESGRKDGPKGKERDLAVFNLGWKV